MELDEQRTRMEGASLGGENDELGDAEGQTGPGASPTEYPFVCPECQAVGTERRFAKQQGLSRHRQASHGIESEYRKKQNARKKTPAAAGRTKRTPRMVKPDLNEKALLKAVFPLGIPLDPELMALASEWIETARELHAAK